MKRRKNTDVESTNDDESVSSCETRRKIEDLHEMRRYQDELGVEDTFDMI